MLMTSYDEVQDAQGCIRDVLSISQPRSLRRHTDCQLSQQSTAMIMSIIKEQTALAGQVV